MENSKQSFVDISGPSRTEQSADCGSSLPNHPKISTAAFTVGVDSQVMKRLFYTISMLYSQFISDSIYLITFFKSRAALMKLKVPLLPEIVTKVNGLANVQLFFHPFL